MVQIIEGLAGSGWADVTVSAQLHVNAATVVDVFVLSLYASTFANHMVVNVALGLFVNGVDNRAAGNLAEPTQVPPFIHPFRDVAFLRNGLFNV